MEHFRRTGPVAPDDGLTAREREVLAMIGQGLRNGEVAETLKLSENTVAGYIKSIYRKLGISSRAEASWHAARLGLGERGAGHEQGAASILIGIAANHSIAGNCPVNLAELAELKPGAKHLSELV